MIIPIPILHIYIVNIPRLVLYEYFLNALFMHKTDAQVVPIHPYLRELGRGSLVCEI